MVIYICPNDRDFRVWRDAYFSISWFPEEAKDDLYKARYRSLFVVSYLLCPVLWKSQLRTEIYLRSTESEYIALNQTLCKTIPIIDIPKYRKALGYL